MSRQYYAKNPEAKGFWEGDDGLFDVNSAGAQLLGVICFEAGWFSKSIYEKCFGEKETPMVTDRAKCLEGASRLKALTAEQRERLWKDTGGSKRPKEGRFHQFTLEEFNAFLDSWIRFLEVCDGYDTDPGDLDEWRKQGSDEAHRREEARRTGASWRTFNVITRGF